MCDVDCFGLVNLEDLVFTEIDVFGSFKSDGERSLNTSLIITVDLSTCRAIDHTKINSSDRI